MNKIEQDILAKRMTDQSVIQFDLVKDRYGLAYDKDFETFALAYTLGAVAALKSIPNKKKKKGDVL